MIYNRRGNSGGSDDSDDALAVAFSARDRLTANRRYSGLGECAVASDRDG